jgi:uncharacterized protein YecE (DUF72 family)
MLWHLGTMTFGNDDWLGSVYPEGLASSRRLSYYATLFRAIELNTTFHAIPIAETVARWREQVGEGFRFAVKAPRAVTHDTALAFAGPVLAEFVNVVRGLGPHLGPVLLQLPPEVTFEQFGGLATLVGSLPEDVRFAVEFRSATWFRRETLNVLRARNIALVAADLEGHPESSEVVPTADFLYVRLLGRHGKYPDQTRERFDPTPRLIDWQRRIAAAASEADVGECWVFFNDDYAGHAPATLRRFAKVARVPLPAPPVKQRSLFGP